MIWGGIEEPVCKFRFIRQQIIAHTQLRYVGIFLRILSAA